MDEIRPPWILLAHPLLLRQMAIIEAASAARKRPVSADARLIEALRLMMTEIVPADPLKHGFAIRGRERHGWREARFGAGRFALFFEADAPARRIVYGWVADRAARRRAWAAQMRGEPSVLLGRFCTVSQNGRIRVPDVLRSSLALSAGALVSVQELYGHVRIAPVPAAETGAMRDPAILIPAAPAYRMIRHAAWSAGAAD